MSNILSIIAVLFGGVIAAILKVLFTRAFKTVDEEIKLLWKKTEKIDKQEQDNIRIDKELVRLIAFKEQTDRDFVMIRADVLREVSLLTGHLETIHRKIDNLDEKLERVRSGERRR